MDILPAYPLRQVDTSWRSLRALEIGGIQFIDSDETGGEGICHKQEEISVVSIS
jgi:hypothetical protein